MSLIRVVSIKNIQETLFYLLVGKSMHIIYALIPLMIGA
jgi:hypothetical protein